MGENSPNSSCHIWNYKSVFLLKFPSLFNAMGDKSSVLFYLKLSTAQVKFHQICSLKVYKVSAKKNVEELCLWYQRVIVCTSSFLQGVWASNQIFEKGGGGGLDGTWAFRRGLLRKRGMTSFREGGCNLYIKNKLKSEIFNDKKSL